MQLSYHDNLPTSTKKTRKTRAKKSNKSATQTSAEVESRSNEASVSQLSGPPNVYSLRSSSIPKHDHGSDEEKDNNFISRKTRAIKLNMSATQTSAEVEPQRNEASVSQLSGPPNVYSLRSSSIPKYDHWSDEEVENIVVSVDYSHEKPTRRKTLSEARFRKKMVSMRKVVSSTPLSNSSEEHRPPLNFDNRIRSEQRKTICHPQAVLAEPQPMDTIAEADDYEREDLSPPASHSDVDWSDIESRSLLSWMCWKELALLLFLIAIGIVGYMFYSGC